MGNKSPELLMSSIHLTDQGPWESRLKQVHASGFDGVEIFGEDIISGNLTEDSNIEETGNSSVLINIHHSRC